MRNLQMAARLALGTREIRLARAHPSVGSCVALTVPTVTPGRRKLGQQLVWQLMQGSMRPEIQQLLFVLGYAVERQETERVTHFVTSLVKGYFDECPWIPSLKRLFKLSGL